MSWLPTELLDRIELHDSPLLLDGPGPHNRAERMQLHSRLQGTQRSDDPEHVRSGLLHLNGG